MNTEIRPGLSVIVAAHNSKRELLMCLSALLEQYCLKELSKYEIIVVGCLNDDVKKHVEQKFPLTKTLQVPTPVSVPCLRSIGIKESKGDILALLEDHCIPENTWVQSILRNHLAGNPVVGGAVENGCVKKITDWAVYFFEYSAFMNPVISGKVMILPGNNISYERSVIQYFDDLLEKNLWESFWHERLVRKGVPLFSAPDMIVFHNRSFRIMKFWYTSFIHGCNHAVTRSHRSRIVKILWILSALFLPFILTFRVGNRVFKKQRYIKEFLISSPVIFWFYIAWVAGEINGTFTGRTLKENGWSE